MKNWELNEIDSKLIELALQEDLGLVFTDATTQQLFPHQSHTQTMALVNKEERPIVLSGLALIPAIMASFETDYTMSDELSDGDIVAAKSEPLTLSSSASTLLMAERTLLNFLRHLSAIATLTRQFVDAVSHTKLKILDTRKTTPGWRHLEKYAVACGGGVNHRMGLYDAIMVKDTHVDLLGGMAKALEKLPEGKAKQLPVIIEVRNEADLQTILDQGLDKVDRVLLDNMSTDRMSDCVKLCDGKLDTEASGNLNLSTIKAVAECGVDYASIGMLTHSAGNVDLSFRACS